MVRFENLSKNIVMVYFGAEIVSLSPSQFVTVYEFMKPKARFNKKFIKVTDNVQGVNLEVGPKVEVKTEAPKVEVKTEAPKVEVKTEAPKAKKVTPKAKSKVEPEPKNKGTDEPKKATGKKPGNVKIETKE